MTMLAEVKFNDEEVLVFPATPFPGDKERIDLTATVADAERHRQVEHPEYGPLDHAGLVVSVCRHVPQPEAAFAEEDHPRDEAGQFVAKEDE